MKIEMVTLSFTCYTVQKYSQSKAVEENNYHNIQGNKTIHLTLKYSYRNTGLQICQNLIPTNKQQTIPGATSTFLFYCDNDEEKRATEQTEVTLQGGNEGSG